MAITKGEGIQWIMTVINTVHSIFDSVGGIHEKLPEGVKQKIPGFLGLSLADEQIFNGVLGQLKPDKQVIIKKFLYKRCEKHERDRFINVVAGMEVVPGKPEETEKRFDKDGNLLFEKRKAGSDSVDYREKFLDSFADIIQDKFGGDLDEAYNFCVGGRMIITDPITQKAKKFWKDLEIISDLDPSERYQGPFWQIKKTFKKLIGR